jgi:hypothetical protein
VSALWRGAGVGGAAWAAGVARVAQRHRRVRRDAAGRCARGQASHVVSRRFSAPSSPICFSLPSLTLLLLGDRILRMCSGFANWGCRCLSTPSGPLPFRRSRPSRTVYRFLFVVCRRQWSSLDRRRAIAHSGEGRRSRRSRRSRCSSTWEWLEGSQVSLDTIRTSSLSPFSSSCKERDRGRR